MLTLGSCIGRFTVLIVGIHVDMLLVSKVGGERSPHYLVHAAEVVRDRGVP